MRAFFLPRSCLFALLPLQALPPPPLSRTVTEHARGWAARCSC